jgi:hypothetical protein
MEKVTSDLNLPLDFGILNHKGQFMLDLQFLPFELNKALPEEGVSKRKLYSDKYGSPEQAKAAEDYMNKLGQMYTFSVDTFNNSVGIKFNYVLSLYLSFLLMVIGWRSYIDSRSASLDLLRSREWP